MPTPHPSTPSAGERAAAAAGSVRHLFSRRSLGVPGTRLGAISFPRPTGPRAHWHYWWQAHFLDCLLDEHLRDPQGDALPEARRLVRGIRLRNGGRWQNAYYDDMAWLALALQRLDAMDGRRRPRRRVRVLRDALRSAHTQDLGGGIYWNTARDYKNTPSTAPAALFFARTGDTSRAQELLDWLRAHLYDPATGLYLDGVKTDGTVERSLHTYNQGTVLGALLATGGSTNLGYAAALVDAVSRNLADDDGVLPLSADGDAGLFTGILARYLALVTPGIAPEAAATAGVLVRATAERLWANRSAADPAADPAVLVFPPHRGGPVSLSSQIQAWMVLEAEASYRHRIIRC